MKVTLKDIADATGVSITAVSKVLNRKPIRISDEKREEILETADRLDYRVNRAARALVTSESGLVGLIVPDIENPYFSRLAKHLEKRCLEEDRVLLILNSNEKLEMDLKLLDLLASRQVDGIFLCPSFEAFANDRLKRYIERLNIPLVLVDRVFKDLEVSQITFDNAAGAYRATAYLIDKGHQRIGIIAPPLSDGGENARLKGYLCAHEDHRLPIAKGAIARGDYGYNSGYTAGKELLKSEVTAVFSCNDRMTLGFLKALREARLNVPEDLSLISNDNIPDDYTFGLAITTIIQDVARLAEESYGAYRALVDSGEIRRTVLMPTLIERNSVTPPADQRNR